METIALIAISILVVVCIYLIIDAFCMPRRRNARRQFRALLEKYPGMNVQSFSTSRSYGRSYQDLGSYDTWDEAYNRAKSCAEGNLHYCVEEYHIYK